MKLQLTAATTVRAYAALVGPASDVIDDARKVLGVFASEAHDPFTRRDMNAVLNQLGHTLPTDGDVWYQLSSVIEGCAVRASSRGYWTQGSQVGTSRPAPAPSAPATRAADPIAQAAMSGATIEITTKPGVGWVPTAPTVEDVSEGYYAEDPGLRRIAVANSTCFGSYNSKAAPCGSCPLARFCANATLSFLADIASRLDAETADQLHRAEVASRAPAAPAPSAQAPTRAPANSPAPADPAVALKVRLDAKYGEDGWEAVALPFDGVCSGCDGQVAENADVIHVGGSGMYHINCA